MDIKDLLEKSLSFGLGLAAYSKDKIEELVEEMVKRGEVAQKDARTVAGDLVKKGEEQRDEIRRLIRAEIALALKEAGVVGKEDAAPADEGPSS
jgi:polyhydroxyalkanoate synthesis regulator phasin